MRLTTSSCRLGGTISARMKRWPLSGSTVGCVIGLPAFADAPVWCRKRSRWSTPPLHCLPPTTSMEQQQNSPCHCVFNTLLQRRPDLLAPTRLHPLVNLPGEADDLAHVAVEAEDVIGNA